MVVRCVGVEQKTNTFAVEEISRCHRTPTWSGLAGEKPLFVVAWPSRSSESLCRRENGQETAPETGDDFKDMDAVARARLQVEGRKGGAGRESRTPRLPG